MKIVKTDKTNAASSDTLTCEIGRTNLRSMIDGIKEPSKDKRLRLYRDICARNSQIDIRKLLPGCLNPFNDCIYCPITTAASIKNGNILTVPIFLVHFKGSKSIIALDDDLHIISTTDAVLFMENFDNLHDYRLFDGTEEGKEAEERAVVIADFFLGEDGSISIDPVSLGKNAEGKSVDVITERISTTNLYTHHFFTQVKLRIGE